MPRKEVDDVRRTLVQLKSQLREVRNELQDLQHDTAEPHFNGAEDLSDMLVMANEHLVLAALSAQAIAERAISNLSLVERASQRDPLTDTPNRLLLLDRLQSALTMAQRRGARAAVIFVDVDNFKQINDTLGHATGDAVLQMVAQRLQAAVRDSDAVGRYGGDEFLVSLAEVSQVTDSAQVASHLIANIATPGLVNGHLLQMSISAGIAVFPDDASEAVALINCADAAMYRSKRRGGGCFTFYGDLHLPVAGDDGQL